MIANKHRLLILAVITLASLWPLASSALELTSPSMPEITKPSAQAPWLDIFSDVEITKIANTTKAAPGQTITYTITVKNHGPNLAESVLSVDQLPLALEFVSSSQDNYDSFTGMWDIGILEAGESVVLEIITKVKAGRSGEIENIADVTATGIVDNYPTNNFSRAKVVIDPEADSKDDNSGGDDGEVVSTPPPPPPALAAFISGSVFQDIDSNGLKGEEENELSGWVVYLDSSDDGEKDEAEVEVTTASPYKFDNLANGDYIVRVVTQSGWELTSPASGRYAVSIVDETSVTSRDFGVKQSVSSSGGSSGGSSSGAVGGGGGPTSSVGGGSGGSSGGSAQPQPQVLGESTGLTLQDPGLQMSEIPQVLGATELPRTGQPLWLILASIVGAISIFYVKVPS